MQSCAGQSSRWVDIMIRVRYRIIGKRLVNGTRRSLTWIFEFVSLSYALLCAHRPCVHHSRAAMHAFVLSTTREPTGYHQLAAAGLSWCMVRYMTSPLNGHNRNGNSACLELSTFFIPLWVMAIDISASPATAVGHRTSMGR